MAALWKGQHVDHHDQAALHDENEELETELHRAIAKLKHEKTQRKRLEQVLDEVLPQRDTCAARLGEVEQKNEQLGQQLQGCKKAYLAMQQECHDTKKALQQEQAEKQKLRDQVNQFKSLISSSTQLENQVADDVIRAKCNQVFYSIQEFVVKTFRGAKLDITLLEPEALSILQHYAPNAANLPKSFWLKLITCFVSGFMTDCFGPANFFGWSHDRPVGAASALASSICAHHDESRKWLVDTRKLMLANSAQAIRAADGQLAQAMTTEAYHILRAAVHVLWSSTVEEELTRIFIAAFELYRLVHSQHARFVIEVPRVAGNSGITTFNAESMEDIGGTEDEADLAGRALEMAIFPMVYKVGTSQGEQTNAIIVVSKAKVIAQVKSSADSFL
ncbi:hypothetical protein LTR37_002993 [Vermiconidia calcicola]|uniref:Uncharacterized protein n=1 Tax=Vermiconidia calcicola TaxID=1690605 RepID=A0ACC3NRV9_9PEZI|nr:hypothetical protein LTR37_002993 [Vermiconidia calcicola]